MSGCRAGGSEIFVNPVIFLDDLILCGAARIVSCGNKDIEIIPGGDQVGTTGITIFGTGTTTRALNSKNDVLVSGELEVDGIAYFDSDIICQNIYVEGVAYLIDSVDDGFLIAPTGTSNWNVIITRSTNRNRDHDHSVASADPTLFLHSRTDPDVDNTQWMSLCHDTTDALINTGTGGVRVNGQLIQDYGGIHRDENVAATIITKVDAFFQIRVFDTDLPSNHSAGDQANERIDIGDSGDYDVRFSGSGSSAAANRELEWDVFEIAAVGGAMSGATQAIPCVVTLAPNPFVNGDRVKIESVVGMVELNNRIFTVANRTATTIDLTDDGGGNIDSTGFGAYVSGGTVLLATKTRCHTHRDFTTANDTGSYGNCSTIATLTAGNRIEVYIKNITGISNFTNETATLSIRK